MATRAPITPVEGFNTAFSAYNAALGLRHIAESDEQIERADACIEPLFNAVVSHPACDLSSIISKCSAIMAEYMQGDVPPYLVEGIMLDLIAMETRQ